MGKKKQFINKKNAVSFLLVHRSQRDPLQADEYSSKHVLLPLDDSNKALDDGNQTTGSEKLVRVEAEKRRQEQQSYGVFYDDDYDYLQHLKPRTNPSLEPLPYNITVVEAKKSKRKQFGNVSLPTEAFGSTCEEDEGLLNLAATVPGPRPDWDPDIVAALDDALDLDDPDNILEDDFVLKANESHEETRFRLGENCESDEEYYFSDCDYSDDNQFSDAAISDDDHVSKFSKYSMTSSVIRRTQELCLLDDRFEKIMEDYDDNEIGALNNEEVTGDCGFNDPLINSITNDLIKDDDNNSISDKENLKVPKVHFDICENNSSNFDGEEFVKIEEVANEQWDCESILSTYSNLYNHPTLIKESSKNLGDKRIALSKRDGIPLGVLSDGKKDKITKSSEMKVSDNAHRQLENYNRSRDETKEEKRARKQKVKNERQMRRSQKKCNKLLFKEERKRQEKSQTAILMGHKIQ
ncbi:protein LTV1 homolog isoform X1 [Xenia sp. Carnegie-2017]|uniref:protein LTV1 homolog isoform X1 n=1 Tax=Xenia sp. Carnegie-2017 TaxID=2897299 RepID=UPI001F04BFF5|nr:protein LTV1 homolog isoform X1 [Xenia sp. Carnegie-2017]